MNTLIAEIFIIGEKLWILKLQNLTISILRLYRSLKNIPSGGGGVKAEDFNDWYKAAELINKKAHLTEKGLEQIRKIKAGMNTGRE